MHHVIIHYGLTDILWNCKKLAAEATQSHLSQKRQSNPEKLTNTLTNMEVLIERADDV